MDSIISWYGGKSQSCKEIVTLMPPHNCYCEPFFGGGSIFFAKPRSNVEIINDINGNLTNMWRSIQRHPEEFLEREKYEMHSEEIFNEYYKDFYSGTHNKLPEIEQSFRFFTMIRNAFSGNFGAGFGFGPSKSHAKATCNAFKEIDKISNRLKGVTIMNRDFQFIIEHFDSKDTLFCADPPYILAPVENYYFKSTGNTTYKSFTLHDHQRLYNSLTNIKGKFILTIDNCDFIKERYIDNQQPSHNRKFWHINNEVYYCGTDAKNRKFVNELIISNYNIEKQKQINLSNKSRNGSKSILEY